MRKVPRNEVKKEPITCSGPGGQNINKGMMGRRLRWNPRESKRFSDEEKELICKKIKLNKKGEIVIDATSFREAPRNLEDGFRRLDEKVNNALKREKPRIPKKKSKAVKKREREWRERHSEKKRLRQKIKF